MAGVCRKIWIPEVLAMCAGCLLLAGCPARPDPAMAESVEFLVTRMTCDDCNVAISFELSRLEGVFEASADYTRGFAQAEYDPRFVSPDDMIAEIEKLGYGARVRQPGDQDIPPAEDGPLGPAGTGAENTGDSSAGDETSRGSEG